MDVCVSGSVGITPDIARVGPLFILFGKISLNTSVGSKPVRPVVDRLEDPAIIARGNFFKRAVNNLFKVLNCWIVKRS